MATQLSYPQPESRRLGEDRIGAGAGMHLEVGAVEVQVLQLESRQVAGLERLELGLDGLAHPADNRLEHLGLRPQRLFEGCFDVAGGQAPHTHPAITRLSKALVLVTPLPNNRDANASVTPPSFGRRSVSGPAVVFTVRSE